MLNIHRSPLISVALLLPILTSASHAAPPAIKAIKKVAPLVLTEKNSGKVSLIKVGSMVEVHLESNASTGYSWSVQQNDAKVLAAQGKPKYVSVSQPGIVGAPGTQVFTFKALKSGKATIKLAYSRPWEKDAPPAHVWTQTFTIKK